MTALNIAARIQRAVDALEDGDHGLALAILLDLLAELGDPVAWIEFRSRRAA